MTGTGIEICSSNNMLFLTPESVESYLRIKSEEGIKPSAINKYRDSFKNLLSWLDGNWSVDKQRLKEWRQYLEAAGYSKNTIQRHVSRVNTFLRFSKREDLCIPKPIIKDLVGRTFGYLTVLEATNKRQRRNIIWKCRCRCGKEVEIPTTVLLGGNTTSCGCLNVEILQYVNRYVEGTSLRQCLDDRAVNENSASGFVGVQPKRDKWTAQITYKGVRYHLGTYEKIEDAVKARARAKEMVIENALKLYEEYADCYGEIPTRLKLSEKEIIPSAAQV